MKNKEIVEKLTNYFLQQDPINICRTLANCMIDVHRYVNYRFLEEEERRCFDVRMEANYEEFIKFIKKGQRGSLEIVNGHTADEINKWKEKLQGKRTNNGMD